MGPSVCPEPGHELREKGHGEEGDPVMGRAGLGAGGKSCFAVPCMTEDIWLFSGQCLLCLWRWGRRRCRPECVETLQPWDT